MNRKALTIVVCAALGMAVLCSVWIWRSSRVFGDGASARAACNHELLDSLALHDGIATTIAIEDDLCDDGLVVSGAFRVILRYADGSRMIERPLLVQGSLGSTARRPSVAVVDRSNVLIVGQKDLVVEQGPKEAAGIRFTYKLE